MPLLPFDPKTMNIVCQRAPGAEWQGGGEPMFNINDVFQKSSGMDWGSPSPECANLALNILCLFLPGVGDEKAVSPAAWSLHRPFMAAFLQRMPRQGGTITGDAIRAWIAEKSK